MQTTGIFTTHRYNIPATVNDPIRILPIGDMHVGSPMCDEDRLYSLLEWAGKQKNLYLLGMGDYMDLASTSERSILTDRKLHESTAHQLESLYKKQTKRLAERMAKAGKWIGLIEGNHFAQFQNSTTSTQLMADILGCRYLGVSSFIRLALHAPKVAGGGPFKVDIWAHHGKAGGRLPGGTINSVARMMDIAEADIYICGHDHQKGAVSVSKLRLVDGDEGPILKHRKVLLVRSGAFLKGYEDGHASYVADAAMRPSDLGVTKISIALKRERAGGVNRTHIDLHASI